MRKNFLATVLIAAVTVLAVFYSSQVKRGPRGPQPGDVPFDTGAALSELSNVVRRAKQ